MKTITKTVTGFILLALTLVIAGCSSGKADINKTIVCEAFNKYGAKELDNFEDLKRIFNNRSLEAEGGNYYTTNDEEEIEFIAKYIIFRFQEIPDWNYQECSLFVATSKDDESTACSYILVFDNEKDAVEVFNYISEDLSYEDNYTSGTESGVDYAIRNEESKKVEMEGVYRQGNSVFWMKAFASDSKGLKDYEKIIKDVGLVSPLK